MNVRVSPKIPQHRGCLTRPYDGNAGREPKKEAGTAASDYASPSQVTANGGRFRSRASAVICLSARIFHRLTGRPTITSLRVLGVLTAQFKFDSLPKQ